MRFQLIIIGAAYGYVQNYTRLVKRGEELKTYNLNGAMSNRNIKFVHGTDGRFAFPLIAKNEFKLASFGYLLGAGIVPLGGEQDNGISISGDGVNLKKISFVSAESHHLGIAVHYAEGNNYALGGNSIRSPSRDTFNIDAYSKSLEAAIVTEIKNPRSSGTEWEESFTKIALSIAKLREINPLAFSELYKLHGVALTELVERSKIQIEKAFKLLREGLEKSKKITNEWSNNQKNDATRLDIVSFLNINKETRLTSETWKLNDFYSDKSKLAKARWTTVIPKLSPNLHSICNRDYRYCSALELMTPEVYTAGYKTDSWNDLVTKLALVITVYYEENEDYEDVAPPSVDKTTENTMLKSFELFARFINPQVKVAELGEDDITFMSGPALPILLCIVDGKPEKRQDWEYTLDGPFTLGKDIQHIITNSDENKKRVDNWLKQYKVNAVEVYASPDLWKIETSWVSKPSPIAVKVKISSNKNSL